MGNLRREFTNLPNLVTMGRVLLVPFVLIFMDNFSPVRSFIASLLYLGAAAGDALDGYLARSRDEVSMLGKFLDPLADKLIVTAVLVFMVALGRVPAWVVVVLIARDLAINGLRSVASAQGLVIAASPPRPRPGRPWRPARSGCRPRAPTRSRSRATSWAPSPRASSAAIR